MERRKLEKASAIEAREYETASGPVVWTSSRPKLEPTPIAEARNRHGSASESSARYSDASSALRLNRF
jgi:hypothetical protein